MCVITQPVCRQENKNKYIVTWNTWGSSRIRTLTWLFLPPVTITPNGFFSIFTSMSIFLFGFISAVAGSCGFSSSFLISAEGETSLKSRLWLIQPGLTLFFLLLRLALRTYGLLALQCKQYHGHDALGTLQQSRCLWRCWLALKTQGILTHLPHRSWTRGLHPDW